MVAKQREVRVSPNGQPKLRDAQTPSGAYMSRTAYADMMHCILLFLLILGTAAYAETLPPVSSVDLRGITQSDGPCNHLLLT